MGMTGSLHSTPRAQWRGGGELAVLPSEDYPRADAIGERRPLAGSWQNVSIPLQFVPPVLYSQVCHNRKLPTARFFNLTNLLKNRLDPKI